MRIVKEDSTHVKVIRSRLKAQMKLSHQTAQSVEKLFAEFIKK
jgi:hypothetical protein